MAFASVSTRAAEAHLLDLEREAFLSLCGLPKTPERVQHWSSAAAL